MQFLQQEKQELLSKVCDTRVPREEKVEPTSSCLDDAGGEDARALPRRRPSGRVQLCPRGLRSSTGPGGRFLQNSLAFLGRRCFLEGEDKIV